MKINGRKIFGFNVVVWLMTIMMIFIIIIMVIFIKESLKDIIISLLWIYGFILVTAFGLMIGANVMDKMTISKYFIPELFNKDKENEKNT